MKKTTSTFFVAPLGILALCAVWFLWPAEPTPPENSTQHEQTGTPTKTYHNESLGIAFSYPTNYFTIERELGNGERSHYNITIVEDTKENHDVFDGKAPGREGPTAVTIDVFQNFEGLSAEAWVRGMSDSNFKLSNDPLRVVNIAGTQGIQYTFDGLYPADAIVIAHGDRIYMLTGTYLDKNDAIRGTFQKILSSLTLSTSLTSLRARDAEFPAAGICDVPTGDTVKVAIFEDLPQPRCSKILPTQKLVITNKTQKTIRVGFSNTLYASLVVASNASYTLPEPLGNFLAPGVHRLSAEPFSGPEIWILE